MQSYTGQLYQLLSESTLPAGAYVAVNGPSDRFGVVIKSTQQNDGGFLHLIRGVPERIGAIPVASF